MPGVSEGLASVLHHYDVQVARVPTQKLHHRLVNVQDKLKKKVSWCYQTPCKYSARWEVLNSW